MDRTCTIDYKPLTVPPKYRDDLFPEHRDGFNPYYMRIGDCQFFIPPERISIDNKAQVTMRHAIRQKSSIKTKTGYRTTEIRMTLWFNDVEQINGVPLAAPEGGEYYIDGLRSLMAQFKRSPFLPIDNVYLNYVHNINAVTLSSLSVTTVPEFPGCLQAELRLFAFNHTPYTMMPDWALDDMFCWPLFRWYYQQQLRPDGRSTTWMQPIYNKDLTGSFKFRKINASNFKKENRENLPTKFTDYEFSDEFVISNISFHLQHLINPLQTQSCSTPTMQYLGSLDTEIVVDILTTNVDDLVVLMQLLEESEHMSREYRDRLVTGHIKFENELVQMAGVEYVLISSMSIDTVDGQPDLFSVRITMVDFDPLQKSQENPKGFTPARHKYYGDLLTVRPDDLNFIIHSVRNEKLINLLELYPDLELPTYKDVDIQLEHINRYRAQHKLNPIGLEKLPEPPNGVWVDPDFYIFYPAIEGLTKIDPKANKEFEELSAKIRSQMPNLKVDDNSLMNIQGYKELQSLPFNATMIQPQDPNEVYRRMLHDSAIYNKRGSMLRAFPSYMFLFVDEGQWMDGRRLWTNYYSYHSIMEVSIHMSRQQPIHTAYIHMTNIYGNLTTSPRLIRSNATGLARVFENLGLVGIRDQMVMERANLVDQMRIQAGARVHLRLGYGSSASTYPVVFNGQITEISASDEVLAVCQSDGMQLTNIYAEWGPRASNTMFFLGNEPKNILDSLLSAREGLYTSWFGEANRFGIEHFGYIIREHESIWGFIKSVVSTVVGVGNGNAVIYDVTKNIYRANSETGDMRAGDLGPVFSPFDGEANLQIWLHGKSPWDISQVLAHANPGYIAYPHPHGFHSTMFFGRPQWFVRYNYILTGTNENQATSYREVVKPFQQLHLINSWTDIIDNSIKATSDNLITTCRATYTLGGAVDLSPAVHADRNIRPENQRTDIIDSTTLQDFWAVPATLERFGDTILGIQPGKQIATRIAISHLMNSFKLMYDGEIIILGDPAIKPHDLVGVVDVYQSIYGNVEVREVVHSLSLETGFISSITPDLCVTTGNDKVRGDLLRAAAQNVVVGGVLQYAKRHLAQAMATRMATLGGKILASPIIGKSVGLTSMAIKLGIAGKIIGGIGLLGGPISWIGIAATLALWGIVNNIIESITDIIGYDNCIKIYPLTYKNSPLVAGIGGHKDLIPGGYDKQVYPDGPSRANQARTQTAPAIPVPTGPPGSGTDFPIIMPLDVEKSRLRPQAQRGVISSYFSATPVPWRRNQPHLGIDLVLPYRSPVRAVADGTVRTAAAAQRAGRFIIIDHERGYSTHYLHLDSMEVSAGQQVKRGQIIGRLGFSGEVFPPGRPGAHLHFEIRLPGRVATDPLPYLMNSFTLPRRLNPLGGEVPWA